MTPLRRRMLEDMSIRNFAEKTQQSYLEHVSRYARHFHRSPEELGPEQVREYQLHLTETRKLAPSTISIATSALRFLYRVTLKRNWEPADIPMPKKPFKLAVVLSRAARIRSRALEGDRHRQPSNGSTGRSRQGSQRPLRDAVTSIARRIARVLEGHASHHVAVSGRHPRAANHAQLRRAGVPQGAPSGRQPQADHPAFPAACVRHASARGRHRRAQDPAVARPSKSGHDLALSEDRDFYRVRHDQPLRPAAQDRSIPAHTESTRRFLTDGHASHRARGGGHLSPGRTRLPSEPR